MVVFAAVVLLSATTSSAIEAEMAKAFAGQDLHLQGGDLVSHQLDTDRHALVFSENFSMSIGGNNFSSDQAVVLLESMTTGYSNRVMVDYNAKVYLAGNVLSEKTGSAKTVDLNETSTEEGLSKVIYFTVSGEVFVTAEKRKIADPGQLELYKRAVTLFRSIQTRPAFVVQPGAKVPGWPEPLKKTLSKKIVTAKPVKKTLSKKTVIVKPVKADKVVVSPEKKEPTFRYPVNLAPAGEEPLHIESVRGPDGTDIVTVTGRLYIWQKQDETDGLLELQADNTVIFSSTRGLDSNKNQKSSGNILPKGNISAVYMSGDVLITEGSRTIRASQVYYDLQHKKAVVIDAEMRSFDTKRGIPIYVRAAKLRQLAVNQFSAENVTLTSSEFYKSQISSTIGKILITDTTPVDEQENKIADNSYDAQMHDVRLKLGEKTVFWWPFMRSNLQRPDVPIKSLSIGSDNTWGTSVETQWYLSRLLGLREPEGTDATFGLDYFSKRGIGGGMDIEYERDDHFGRLQGYIIHDRGEDRLGRIESRKNLKPGQELRGRFGWLHRHFLSYNWQLTTGLNYISDENFIEQYYRHEFGISENQETYFHLKRLQDNWAISLLGKGRINDFTDQLEELPSFEYHLTGQSFFDHTLTLYSDTQISRLRQRIGNEHSILIDEKMYSFASHRTEVDMPIWVDPFKIVPFVAGTFGYDDRSGFRRSLVDGRNTGRFGDNNVWLGEAGVRVGTQFWKIYPDVKSRLWNLNQMRHIIKPQLTAVLYEHSDAVVEQRDILNFAISQRLQTKRGFGDKQRAVDWMRLDIDFTWVNDSADSSAGPDRFIWNKPLVPLRVFSAPDIFNGDLSPSFRRFEMFGPRRNYFGADYIWRISDTSVILSDMNFDLQSSVVQQFDIGISRLVWPDLSYYIGSRYLRRVEILDEKGSNAFTFAATYAIDPRYTVVFSQQFDFDYGKNLRSEITLIRRYNRMYLSLSYSADASLDRQAIVISLWPQGVPELAFGQSKYAGMNNSVDY